MAKKPKAKTPKDHTGTIKGLLSTHGIKCEKNASKTDIYDALALLDQSDADLFLGEWRALGELEVETSTAIEDVLAVASANREDDGHY